MWRWMVIVLSVLALAVTSSAQMIWMPCWRVWAMTTPRPEEAVDTAAEALTEENVEDPFATCSATSPSLSPKNPRKR